jgi:molybdate transport system substrate-binding protein
MVVPAGSEIPTAGTEPTPNEVLDWAGSLARCATGVPCGDATDRWITASSGLGSPGAISIENNVRAVLAKVRRNEVDAGLVYRTDALFAGDEIEVVSLGPDSPETAIVGVTIGPPDSNGDSMGAMFLAFLASDEGQALFLDAGFGSP